MAIAIGMTQGMDRNLVHRPTIVEVARDKSGKKDRDYPNLYPSLYPNLDIPRQTVLFPS